MFVNNLGCHTTKAQQVNFSGHNLLVNDNGDKYHRFFIPKIHYNEAVLELKKFRLDSNDNINDDFDCQPIQFKIPQGQSYIDINPKKINASDTDVVGYRFKIDGEYFYDKHRFHKTPEGQKYNLADKLTGDALSLPKLMYHVVPNNFNPHLRKGLRKENVLGEVFEIDDSKVRMNNVSLFNADLSTLQEKIPYLKKMGFRRILSTPIFGQDNLSTHGYWTTNPFQITDKFGNIEDFKKFQIELFKNGMGLVADGAFVNEGLQGIHIKDILEHGAKSPFVNWFEMHNFPDSPLKLGILPNIKNGYDNFDIRVINSPVIWNVDKKGYPTANFGQKNPNYDKNKKTYIQTYDKRLLSKEQLNSKDIIKTYDIKEPKNPNELENWMDTVQLYSFAVPAEEVIQKAKFAIKSPSIEAKEQLKEWKFFELTDANSSGGSTLWAGNKDIYKLRFTLPAHVQHHILLNANTQEEGAEQIEKIKKATQEVQDYIVSVGSYWTNKTSKILAEYIIAQLGDAKNPAELRKQIISKAGTSLPESLKNITEVQLKNVLEGKYTPVEFVPRPDNAKELLEEVPMEAIGLNDELLSIFAAGNFKNHAENKLFGGIMGALAIEILKNADEKSNKNNQMLDDNGDFKDSSKRFIRLIGDDVKKFLVLKSLMPHLSADDILSNSSDTMKQIKEVTLKQLGIVANTQNEKEAQLIGLMRQNLRKMSPNDIEKIASYVAKKLCNVTPEKMKIADFIIDKTESGLDWRIDAAKDIADIESFNSDFSGTDETWGEVLNFWKKFNDAVTFYNPRAYKIGEVTDTEVSYSDLTPKITSAGELERKVIDNANFTTQSNYTYIFSFLHRFFSGMPEYNSEYWADGNWLAKGKLLVGRRGVDGYLYSGGKNNLNFSHIAAGNHDKPRTAHGHCINVQAAYQTPDRWHDAFLDPDRFNRIKNDLSNELMKKSHYFSIINNLQQDAPANYFDDKPINQLNLAKEAALTDAVYSVLKNKMADNKLSNNDFENYQNYFVKAFDVLANRNTLNSDMFFYKTFEYNYDEAVDYIKKNLCKDDNFKKFADSIKPLVHDAYTKPAQIRGLETMKLLVALPGNPTVYAGEELLETGAETKAKNCYLQNRNLLQWKNLSDNDYQHVKNFNEKVAKILNLRHDKNLSCLTNGDTIILKEQSPAAEGNRVIGMYRYNENDDAIVLLNNIGYNAFRNVTPYTEKKIDKVDLSEGDVDLSHFAQEGLNDKEKYQNDIGKMGLPNNRKLKTGSIFVDALDESKKYEIHDDGNLYAADGSGAIVLDSAVKILKRVK